MAAITTSVDTYTAEPFATVPVDGDAADLLDKVGAALEQDPRALGPAVGYDYDRQRVSAIFQLQPTHTTLDVRGADLTVATTEARRIFDSALSAAGVEARTTGVAIVEGDDPDQLP